MATIYKAVRNADRTWTAFVLSPKSTKATEMCYFTSTGEMHEAVQEQYGSDVTRVRIQEFDRELQQRQIHTPEMCEILRNSYMGDLTRSFVYGSPLRPMSGSWARIADAVYINADKQKTGYHTYIAVPDFLHREIVEAYDLAFVSRPALVEKQA